MAPLLHVDEIHDDQAAEVAQPNLPRDFGGRFEVHGIDDIFLVAATVLVRARVDVDRDERLGFVDDDLAAGRQGHLALAGLLDLALDVEPLEDRDAVLVERDLAGAALGNLGDQFLSALVVVLAVDQHAVDFLGEKITDGALDEIGFLIKTGRRTLVFHLGHDLLPSLEEDVQVADEIAGLLAFPGGAHDDAHAFRQRQFVDQRFQPLAFERILDLPGNAATITERREDQVPSGQGEIGRGARALRADGPFCDLDDNVAAGRVELRDVLDGRLGGARRGIFLLVDADDLHGGVGGGRQHVPIVQERILGIADVDEGRLEARVEVLDAALVDAANHPVVGLAFDLKFFEPAIDEERHALLERFRIDNQLPIGALVLLEHGENLLEKGALLGALGGARL